MDYLKKTAFLFVVLFFIVSSQSKTLAMPDLRFYVDLAGFRGSDDGSKTFQEFYISFPTYRLTFTQKANIYFAAYEIDLVVCDTLNHQIINKNWQGFSQIDSLKQADQLTTLEVAGVSLPAGKFILKLRLTDLESKASGKTEQRFEVIDFKSQEIQISEIQFARSIKKSSSQTMFVKNNIEILPNPSRVFGIESPFIYFYCELYNLMNQSSANSQYMKEYFVLDSRGDTVKSASKEITSKHSTSIWAEKINILDLISGKYFLHLKLTNVATGFYAKKQDEFWVHNPFKTISFKQYRLEDVEEFRSQVYHIIKEEELLFFDQLNIQAKINYINEFWKNLDADFRTEHLKRFYTARERFASSTLPGWKADRGRIYIMYGPPDEIEREPTSGEARAYEIWIYERLQNQGQVQFVFVDFGIYGNYQLVHSNIKGSDRLEIYNPDWMDETRISR